jgi:arabinan endo-1,5-alpha-L-arabinosidase
MLELTGDLEMANPMLFRAGGKYYVLHTGIGLPMKSSADMLAFKAQAPVFEQNPSWIAEQVPDATALWSPTLATFGGLIHLYYAASTFGSNRSCIGHATATTVESGFVDHGPLICSNVMSRVADDFNAIDPSLLLDDELRPWLAFGSYDSGIKLIALDLTGNCRDSVVYPLAARPSNNPAIQACELTKRGDFYYLFASFDLCCKGSASTYRLMVGRAETITGPYLDREGVDMLEGGGTLMLESGTRWRGPGSNMVHVEGRKRFNVYHAYDADANGRVTLRIGELYYDNDGWPVTAGP